MGSREIEKKEHFYKLPIWTHRNGQLMLLLWMVPEFQKDIANIRKEFNIPVYGYLPDYTDIPETDINGRRETEIKCRDEIHKKIKDLGGYFTDLPVQLKNTSPTHFQERVIGIGEKFHLPYNLYNNIFYGIAHFILTDVILLPHKNWTIEQDIKYLDRSLPIRWVGIRAHVPLNEEEAKQAISEMNAVFENPENKFPKTIIQKSEAGIKRTHQLIEIAKMIEEQKLKTDGRNAYVQGSYLSMVAKNKDVSVSRLRTLEKQYPDQLKKIRAKKSKDKMSMNRADDLANELFGFGIY